MNESLTIFYTDDDQEDLEFFKEVVGSFGRHIEVVTQNKPAQLLHALKNPPPSPQIIFLDVNMPLINGFDLLQQIRAHAEFSDIPVVMFSTSRDEHNIAKSRSLGANYYLPKLESFDAFKKSIDHTLKINWSTFSPTAADFAYRN
ncbi:MAG: response regulator [Flavobacterium sp. BFFFF1]|uniref:response regulator n=1 Tax=Flavobacterium sp. BFFFF1 TaxID=2015557 RepID=UPI000BD20CF8|nr:response regulator [Flavobacterium sp. BFFFF1]OYU80777.1 MAG: response regulator [Flavobacterium sp. BFFFF1]